MRTLLADTAVTTVVFKKSGLSATVKFKKLPTKVKVNAPFELRFFKPDTGTAEKGPFIDPGFLLNGKTVHFEMEDHGHGTKDPVTVTRTVRNEGKPEEEVVFEVDKLFFSMTGEWKLHIDLKKDEKSEIIETGKYTHIQK